MNRKSLTLISTLLLIGIGFSFAGGNGTSTNPYLIENCDQLQNMSSDLSANYQLNSSVNCSETKNWSEGSGFDPIGPSYSNKFSGTFDGQGYVVNDLYINRGSDNYVGLFGRITGTVKNVGVINGNITGDTETGGLVGVNDGGSVLNSYAVEGVTRGNTNNVGNAVGGLVGWNLDGSIEDSYATGKVTGHYTVGGLTASNDGGSVSNSYSTGEVTGNSDVGGLIGKNESGSVSSSFWDVNTSGQSGSAGGTGKTTSEMQELTTFYPEWDFTNTWGFENCTGEYPKLKMFKDSLSPCNPSNISTCSGLQAMGFDRSMGASYTLTSDIDCSETSSWNDGDGFNPIGNFDSGFNGVFDGKSNVISDLYIDRRTNDDTSLFGYIDSNANITNVSMKNVDVTGNNHVGGLIGQNAEGSVSNSNATGSVSGDYSVGGLIGYNRGSVSDCYADASVSAFEYYGGGLIGRNYQGSVSGSHASGSVDGNWVGGLVGFNDAHIEYSYSNVSVSGGDKAGGLVGVNDYYASVSDSYATGSVSGGSNVGGLVGYNEGDATASNSYSTGDVEGNDNVGGLVGQNIGSVSNSYWDTNTSNQSKSDGGTGKTTSEMQELTTFYPEWDFTETWFMNYWYNSTKRYPHFQWPAEGGRIVDAPTKYNFTYSDNETLATVKLSDRVEDIIINDEDTGYKIAEATIDFTGEIEPNAGQFNATSNVTNNGYGYVYTQIPNSLKVTGSETLYLPKSANTSYLCILNQSGVSRADVIDLNSDNCGTTYNGELVDSSEDYVTLNDNYYKISGLTHSGAKEVSSNEGPNASLNFPSNGANVSTSPLLNVTVTDPNGDTMDVKFIKAPEDTEIATVSNVENGSTASTTWNDLEKNTTYRWYVNISDGYNTTTSNTWSFNTTSEQEKVYLETTTAISARALMPVLVAVIFAAALLYFLKIRGLL